MEPWEKSINACLISFAFGPSHLTESRDVAGNRQSFETACEDVLRSEIAKYSSKAAVEDLSAVYPDFTGHRKERTDG